jgi:sec-independent protein translocase protein TatA
MFGIGGSELIFILFIVLMLFGADKVPEIARTMGKAMAQLKNATNDIKNEIHKGVEENGFDQKTFTNIKGSVTSEINKAKENLLGHTSSLKEITAPITEEIKETKNILSEPTSNLDKNWETDAFVNKKEGIETKPQNADLNTKTEDIEGPIKRQK